VPCFLIYNQGALGYNTEVSLFIVSYLASFIEAFIGEANQHHEYCTA
jgi:hypothetical protein